MKSFICQMEIGLQVNAFPIFVSLPFMLTLGENFAFHENIQQFFHHPQTIWEPAIWLTELWLLLNSHPHAPSYLFK